MGQDLGNHDTSAFGAEAHQSVAGVDRHGLEWPGLGPPRDGTSTSAQVDDSDFGRRPNLQQHNQEQEQQPGPSNDDNDAEGGRGGRPVEARHAYYVRTTISSQARIDIFVTT